MFAFLLEELREWRERRMRRTAAVFSATIALAGALSILQPLVIVLAATALFVVYGWSEGNRYQSGQGSRRLLLAFPVPTRSVVAGKALSTLATWAFFALLLSPPLVLAALARGVAAGAIAACYLSWLVAYFASACAGFLSSLAFARAEGFPGLLLILFWLCSAFFAPGLAQANPFVQAWEILKAEGGAAPFAGMGATALAAALLLAAAAFALSRMRRA
jgi:ABC-type multidrug transport system permease subunit